MATPILVPGSLVTRSGTYRVSHSNGHMSETECVLLQGTLLPSCPHEGCHVTYNLVAAHVAEDSDFEDD